MVYDIPWIVGTEDTHVHVDNHGITTVDSDFFLRNLYSANFVFPNYSGCFEFTNKYSCSKSFPWVETRHFPFFI